MKTCSIADALAEKISGEWGVEPTNNSGVYVLRTTNFTNVGRISFEKVVKREIEEKKVQKKCLRYGDIIIEKSGGSPTQPVGRVVFFDKQNHETYLCNNFTSVLRAKGGVESKYLFYYLFFLYKSGRTLGYQNKTTGIINLKLDRYLENEKICLPSLDEQKNIVLLLDQTDALRLKRKESALLLEQYAQSVFLKIFGDPVHNPKKWPEMKVEDVVSDIVAGTSYGGEQKEQLDDDELGVLKISSVTWGQFNPAEFKAVKKSQIKKDFVTVKKGDLLFSRANTRELVGATSIVDRDYPQLFLPDKLWRIDLKAELCDKNYFDFLLRNKGIKASLTNTATGTSGSMLNISMKKLKNLRIPVPPVNVQEDFASSLEKISNLRSTMNQQAKKLDTQFNVLMQKAFEGSLN